MEKSQLLLREKSQHAEIFLKINLLNLWFVTFVGFRDGVNHSFHQQNRKPLFIMIDQTSKGNVAFERKGKVLEILSF
jgi:hypothetical protein